MEGFYNMKCGCTNCGNRFDFVVPKGVRAKESISGSGVYYDVPGDSYEKKSAECPNCGTTDILKHFTSDNE